MKIKKSYILLAIAFLSGCSEEPQKSTTGSIYGIVSDFATVDPIRGSSIELHNPDNTLITSKVTGNDGTYEFKDIKAGNYLLFISILGYKEVTKSVEVIAGKPTQADMPLIKQPAELRIIDVNNNPIKEHDLGTIVADVNYTFSIYNQNPYSIEWKITENCNWLSISESSGTLQKQTSKPIIVTIHSDSLASGINSYNLIITSNYGSAELKITATKKSQNSNNEYVILSAAGIAVQKTDISPSDITLSSANNLCKGLDVGGFTDWRLPTIIELGTIFSHRTEIGGFNLDYYWSSSIDNGYTSPYLGLYFEDGSQVHLDSYSSACCRCVRSISGENNELPSVETLKESNVTSSSATLGGNITNAGTPAYTEKGVCYSSTSQSPTINSPNKKKPASDNKGTGNFPVDVTDLTANTTYYVCAYATNTQGTAYGSPISFTTSKESDPNSNGDSNSEWVPLYDPKTNTHGQVSLDGLLTWFNKFTFISESQQKPVNYGILTGINNCPTLYFEYEGTEMIGTYAKVPIYYYRIQILNGVDKWLTDSYGKTGSYQYSFGGGIYQLAYFGEKLSNFNKNYDQNYVQTFGFRYINPETYEVADGTIPDKTFVVVSNVNYTNDKPAAYRYLAAVNNHLVFVEGLENAIIFQFGQKDGDGNYQVSK